MGFLDPRLPFVFIVFLGVGLALRSLLKAASNLSFSTFMFSSWYYGGCGGIQTPGRAVTRRTDYKSGPINRSGTHPLYWLVNKSGYVASRILMGERHTTTHADLPAKDSQRASSFLNLRARVSALCAPQAHSSIFSCISRLTFWKKIDQPLSCRTLNWDPFSSENSLCVQALDRCVNIGHAIGEAAKVCAALQQFLKNSFTGHSVYGFFFEDIKNKVVQFVRLNGLFTRTLLQQTCEGSYDLFESRNFLIVKGDLSSSFRFFAPQLGTEFFKFFFVGDIRHIRLTVQEFSLA